MTILFLSILFLSQFGAGLRESIMMACVYHIAKELLA